MSAVPPSPAQAVVIALVTAPADAAERLAECLVERRVVACVNLLAGARSVYRWQGTVERTEETLMICKTTEELVAKLSAALDELHPYEVYELLVTRIDTGSPTYLGWVLENVSP